MPAQDTLIQSSERQLMTGNDDLVTGAVTSQELLPQSKRKYKGPKMSII